MIITIHQPEHLVWLGLLDKISKVDIFVVLDDVQFKKDNFQNRNRIKKQDGWMWLTVPIKKHPLATNIKDIEISYALDWVPKYLQSIKTYYGGAPFFNSYYSGLEAIISKKHALLVDLNIDILNFFLESFGITGQKIIRSSELKIPAEFKGSELCLEICKRIGAKTYLSGPDGKRYLGLDRFSQEGIEVVFHEFHHPVYEQLQGSFLPAMAAIDLLFLHGPKFIKRKNERDA